MRSLKEYIKEDYKKYSVQNLKIVFDILPEEFYLNAPGKYSESDIIIYLGDSLFEKLPADNAKFRKFFGKNYDYIADTFFEYDKFEHLNDSNIKEFNLEWYKEYEENIKDEDIDTFKITNLRYVILFDEFEIQNNNDNIKNILNEIFSKLDSSIINKYPVEIKYNSDSLEFDE